MYPRSRSVSRFAWQHQSVHPVAWLSSRCPKPGGSATKPRPVSHPETRVRLVWLPESGSRVVILKVVHEQDTGQEVILRLCTSAVGQLDHAEPLGQQPEALQGQTVWQSGLSRSFSLAM